jgi:high-affinity iron transporter
MILIGVALTTSLFLPTQQRQPVQDQAPVVRRLAATAQLAAQEYRIGVVNGRVISQAEVDEARLFLQEARRSAGLLPEEVRPRTLREIDSLLELVDRKALPDSIDARVRKLANSLASHFGLELDEIPSVSPSLVRGEAVYRANCASCHGPGGRGDGPLARSLDPPPANLSDAHALRDQSPLDYFRRISIGVVGTAMPAFESRLSPQDRWSVALYASLLRLPQGSGAVPAALQSFATTGRMSDSAVLAALGAPTDSSAALAHVAAV